MTAFTGIVALPTPFPCSVCGSRKQVHHVHIEYRDGTSESRTLDGYDSRGEGWQFYREPKCEACGAALVLTEDRRGEPDLRSAA